MHPAVRPGFSLMILDDIQVRYSMNEFRGLGMRVSSPRASTTTGWISPPTR